MDVVVVGGGPAGWTAANRALELGRSVALIEQSPQDSSGGNALLSGGVFHAAYRDPETPPRVLHDELLDRVGDAARPDVLIAWAYNVRRARDYLIAHGADFGRAGNEEQYANVLQPQRRTIAPEVRDIVGSGAWRNMGPHRLLNHMHDDFVARGGAFIGGARARRLIRDDGKLIAIEADCRDGTQHHVAGRAFVLADGGFQANRECVAEHITPVFRLRGSESDRGDALAMALEVGASTANMRNFYGHLLVKDAQFNDRLWPDPSPDTLISHGILVDGHGRRILDENRGGDGPGAFSDRLCWAVAQSQTPQRCWVVFDERIWETAGRQDGPASINPLLLDEGGTLLRAHSVGDLARLAGLGEDALDATVRDFNRYATNGEPIEPPRSGTPLPLASPLMAIPILIGITFAMGGILVDGHGRALDVQGQPIPGLYSAGGAMAGLQGGTENGYSGGWSEAATFGLLAGEHAALFTAPAREI